MLLLRMIPRPTAIFAGNDLIAFGVLQAIREAGLRCPEDISLIGFDDMEPAAMLNPGSLRFRSRDINSGQLRPAFLIDRAMGTVSRETDCVADRRAASTLRGACSGGRRGSHKTEERTGCAVMGSSS